MPRPRVMVVDDNPFLRHVVRSLLKQEFTIEACAKHGDEAIRRASSLDLDVILLDISIGTPNGFEVARQLIESGCAAKIVFLTVHENCDFIRAAIAMGAHGYVIKARLARDLVSAVKTVYAGGIFVSNVPLAVPGNVEAS